tara:strand:- start:308 stop:1498 length:1191 start_codon:yes stop_codon:yes gene_type:complete
MPIETRVVSGSRSSLNPTVETSNSTTNVNALRDEANSTFEVRPDALSYADILLLVPELGRIVYDTTNETERYYDGSSWLSMSGGTGTSSSVGQRAANFSSLTSGSTIGELAYCNQSEGTQWLPSTLGGTYKPKGWYLWTGTEWISDRENLVNQLQLNVNGLGGKANVGDIRTDVQINALIDANTNGYVTTDNNTQLSDSDITAFGYVKTDNDTQLTDSDISALGYVKTDNNTQLSDADITALGYVKGGTEISFFQVQDDGTTGQSTTTNYATVVGIWDTPSLTDADFTFNSTTGQLLVSKAGNIEFDCKIVSYNVGNTRHELYIELQKNGTTIVADAQYASRNNTQRVGGAYIMGFKDTCSSGDIYILRTKHVSAPATIGVNTAAKMTYMSAKLYT